MCWSLFFNKVVDLRSATLLKRDSNTSVFLWIFAKFLRTPFFTVHLGQLLLIVTGHYKECQIKIVQNCVNLKSKCQHQCFVPN